MATPSTINTWLNELASSIIQDRPHRKLDTNRLQETFRKRVKKHNFARTNPFAVDDHLDGLEEKFQILTLDGLADALRQRRQELRDHHHHWVPDVLDLLLYLTGDPVHNDGLLELYRIPPKSESPVPLRWRDVLEDDPLEDDESLWKVPDFRDETLVDQSGEISELEDGVSSPVSAASSVISLPDESALFLKHAEHEDTDVTARLYLKIDGTRLNDPDVVKEILLFCRGYESILFSRDRGRHQPSIDLRLSGTTSNATKKLLKRVTMVREHIDVVHSWKAKQHDEDYIQAVQLAIEERLASFEASLDQYQQGMLTPSTVIAISVLQTVQAVELHAQDLILISDFLKHCSGVSGIAMLDLLCERLDLAQLCNDQGAVAVLYSLLGPALRLYLGPLLDWIWGGSAETPNTLASVGLKSSQATRQLAYHIADDVDGQVASCLRPHLRSVLACGRAVTILRNASSDFTSQAPAEDFGLQIEVFLNQCFQLQNVPFSILLESHLGELISSILRTRSQEVKVILIEAGLKKTLDAIESLYLAQDRILADSVELRMFEQIDKCADNWNDRFLLADMLEAVYAQQRMLDLLGNTRVAAKFTSARTMVNRRRSVRILTAVTFRYTLSWLPANIISVSSMKVYQRVHLMLMQIRRTKHCLERRGYLQVMSQPIPQVSSEEQKFAQCLAYSLVNLVNVLYDHLTASVIAPMTRCMRGSIYQAQTIDGMIETHTTYVEQLEFACLVSPKLKILRDATVRILDLCIRFSDLVSSPAIAPDTESDAETSSFISARARHVRQDEEVTSDAEGDEDDGGEGYSSFIVLDDDTNIVKEMHKLKSAVKRQLDFLVAGLRGVSHNGTAAMEMEMLADRLDQFQKDYR